MSGIGEDEVRRIARLARLRLGDEDVERLSTEMGSILAHFEEIEAAGTGDGRRIQDRGLAERVRADEEGPDPLELGPERNAPDWRDDFFVVPSLEALSDPGEGA